MRRVAEALLRAFSVCQLAATCDMCAVTLLSINAGQALAALHTAGGLAWQYAEC